MSILDGTLTAAQPISPPLYGLWADLELSEDDVAPVTTGRGNVTLQTALTSP